MWFQRRRTCLENRRKCSCVREEVSFAAPVRGASSAAAMVESSLEGGRGAAPAVAEARFAYGGNMTLEAIALLLTITFLVRVFADIINRARAGRSVSRSAEDEVTTVWRRVRAALSRQELRHHQA